MKRLLKLVVLLVALAPMPGCSDDDSTEPDVADSVTSLRLAIGAQTITVSEGGAITGGPVAIPQAGATITGTFLDASGQAVALPNTFQMNVSSSNTAVLTFARTSSFAGTLTRVAGGSSNLSVSLFHTAEGHDDFGPFTIPVTVQ